VNAIIFTAARVSIPPRSLGRPIAAFPRRRFRLAFAEDRALYGGAVPVALLAAATMLLAGHSGAVLAWKAAVSVPPVPCRACGSG